MRVLILEDEWAIAMVLEEIVAGGGHQVIGPVASAGEAIRLAEHTKPDLALLDIRLLDGGSGLVVAVDLKSRLGIPAIFVTASAEEVERNRGLVLAVVDKPFQPESVLRALRMAETAIAPPFAGTKALPSEDDINVVARSAGEHRNRDVVLSDSRAAGPGIDKH